VTGIVREFVGLPSPVVGRAGAGGHPCQGIYHRPPSGRPRVAFVATHYNVDFSEHYLASFMAERGFGFLGWNTRFRGNEAHFLLDHALAEIGVGVRWLREQAGAEQVVLVGNSGGGSLMAAYEASTQTDDELGGGDLYVSLAAHPGRPQVLTAWMDASVTDESDPAATDPSLDIFNPDNGPPYDAEFITRYRAAQAARNRSITAWAHDELERLRAAGLNDRVFTVQRTWADPRMVDPALDPSDRPTPACYMGDPQRANRGVFGIGIMNTLRTWLSMWSLDESRCGGAQHLREIALPALVIQPTMDTGVFPSDATGIFDALRSTDKERIDLPGDHYFRGPPNAREQLADRIAAWVTQH
jgi:hypothetical protein